MTGIVSIYAVFATRAEADRIGRQMIEEQLAACVNILGPAHSIYRWQGAVEEAEEIPAIFKTSADAASDLISRIAALHSYDNPSIARWDIAETTADYAQWVAEQTR